MGRLHLFEIGEQPAVPAAVRELLIDTLQFGTRRFGFYDPVAPLLAALLAETRTNRVVDLCSGATGPWTTLAEAVRAAGVPDLEVMFTDKHVHRGALQEIERRADPALTYLDRAVDAAEVPAELAGARTMFTGFHHFAPTDARRVLGDACRAGVPIAVFEMTERSVASCLAACVVPFAMLVTTPWMRPLTWKRLALTYLLPVLPLANLWDGIVSSLRSYTPKELEALTADLGGEDYEWRVGRIRKNVFAPTITYLIGAPVAR